MFEVYIMAGIHEYTSNLLAGLADKLVTKEKL